jgi:hypothetical protein
MNLKSDKLPYMIKERPQSINIIIQCVTTPYIVVRVSQQAVGPIAACHVYILTRLHATACRSVGNGVQTYTAPAVNITKLFR